MTDTDNDGIDMTDDVQMLVFAAAELVSSVDGGDWHAQTDAWSDKAFKWTSGYHRFLISQDDGLT